MLEYYNIDTRDGMKLYGTAHISDVFNKEIYIIVHGYFSSNRIGPSRLYYQIGQFLVKKGYNVVRFDLRAMGESEGELEQVKYFDHVSDLKEIVEDTCFRYKIKRVGIIAHCIGCNITLPLLRQLECIERIIFISPYFTSTLTLNAFFDRQQQQDLKILGYTYRKGIYVDGTFFTGINLFDEFTDEIARSSDHIDIISAEKDQFISLNEIRRFYKRVGKKPLIVRGADHNYLNQYARQELIEYIYNLLRRES